MMKSLSRYFGWSLLLLTLALSGCGAGLAYVEGVDHARNGEFHDAFHDYNRAIELHPSIEHFHYSRANALRGMGEYRSALQDYQLALLYGFSPGRWAYYGMALTYTDLQDYQKAIASYDTYVKYDDTFPTAYYNRGRLYHQLGDHESALADFDQVRLLDPLYIDAYSASADVYYDQGDVANALAWYSRYLAVNPDHPAPYVFQRVAELEGRHESP